MDKLINNIIDKRALHLPKIHQQIARLKEMQEAIAALDGVIAIVKEDINQGHGVYFSLLEENPKMKSAFDKVTTTPTKKLIQKQIALLEKLEKRFSRKTVRIAMIGYERQGKSTFLQAISGLNDKVIPAYSGTSCTGAVSVIHNTDGNFHADVQFYTTEEFLAIANEKLAKFFPTRNLNVGSVRDLQSVNLEGFQTNDANLSAEFIKFKDTYCGHVDDYINLLGIGTKKLTDEDEIIKHVAQYEEFKEPTENAYKVEKNDGSIIYKKDYYKYIAVKNVDIYKTFDLIDARRIELVDTIGLGDSSDAERIEAEMFRVLREDCDAAVDVYRPEPVGGLHQNQINILTKLSQQLADRNPSQWILYVINRIKKHPVFRNEENIPKILQSVKANISYFKVAPVNPNVLVIDGWNVDEVRDFLVIPLLKMITTNLPMLDAGLMKEVNQHGETLMGAYFKLMTEVQAVLNASSIRDAKQGKLFDSLYGTLKLSNALRRLDDEEYAPARNKPCPQIQQQVEAIIKDLYSQMPKKEDIAEEVDKGQKASTTIFMDFCDELRTSIVRKFESVNDDVIIPLREEVKKKIAEILFSEGRWCNLPLKSNVSREKPSLEWLQAIVEERIKESDYPSLYHVMRYLLDFDLSLKYLIEYDITRSLGLIDQMSPEFMTMKTTPRGNVEEQASAIRNELYNRVPRLQKKLREGNNEFALIPSHSFWATVNNFRTDIVRNPLTKSDMREFYRDHALMLWKDDFKGIADKQEAFGQWNEISEKISSLYSPELLKLEISGCENS